METEMELEFIESEDENTKIGIDHFKNKNYDKALVYFNDVSMHNQYNFVPFYNLGVYYFFFKEYEKALENFLSASKKGDGKCDYRTFYALGKTCYRLNSCENAKDYFIQTINLLKTKRNIKKN